MNKLNALGIGPKIGAFAIPWITAAIFFSIKFRSYFAICNHESGVVYYLGIILLGVGIIMYFSTVPLLLKGIKETKLITKGAYFLCCNPLYAAIIIFIVPGVALIMNSWLVLSTSLIAYLAFKLSIGKEYLEMTAFFGSEYLKYRAETPEFFPFPFRKLFGKSGTL